MTEEYLRGWNKKKGDEMRIQRLKKMKEDARGIKNEK